MIILLSILKVPHENREKWVPVLWGTAKARIAEVVKDAQSYGMALVSVC